jgi:K+-transporting ATPase ATPase C chain
MNGVESIRHSLPRQLLQALRLTGVIFVVTGLVYTLAITGISQLIFHDQANGSLLNRNGRVAGSSLIGQEFTDPRYFFGRPSASNNDAGTSPQPYNAENSGGSNLAPSNKVLIARIKKAVAQVRKDNGIDATTPVPVDLVTTDFSGFDPDITEAAALIQVKRVARARGLDSNRVHALVQKYVQGRVLLVFGEPHVNVLALNLALNDGEAG